MSAQDSLAEPFERLLRECCTPQSVRGMEHAESARNNTSSNTAPRTAADLMWAQLEGSGFLDALTPEATGGAGLALSDVYPLVEACGAHALPLPFAETMLARAVLAAAGVRAPREPIALAQGTRAGDEIVARFVPYARTAQTVLLAVDDALYLTRCAQAQLSLLAPHGCAGELRWQASALGQAIAVPAPLLHAQASLLAAQLAGAMQRVFDMTLDYANQRVQFGKPIGKFQAVQHQISVMAEQVFMARMAARMGFDCAAAPHLPSVRSAAIAKAVTSEAAASVAAIAHALHGAIGMTAEFDLQLYTRRLHEWRICAGAESYWQRELGAALLRSGARSPLEYMLEQRG